MQKTNEKRDAKKEVMCFLGQDWKIYCFDGELPPRLYEEVIPIIKKKRKKRKKGFDRERLRTIQRRISE